MPETLTPTAPRKAHQMPPPVVAASGQPLRSRQTGVGLLNLRGNPADPAFLAAVEQALGLQPPLAACTTVTLGDLRVVWTGPDEWMVAAPRGQEATLAARLRTALAGQHCAVTDVSSGFFLVDLVGPRVRDTLAQGCPMDLHPRAFPAHRAVGTHFYKVGLTLWLTAEPERFQMLVRRSFIDHFWQLIDHASLESGRIDF
jgi:sarcosine oxidase, subunit gamma